MRRAQRIGLRSQRNEMPTPHPLRRPPLFDRPLNHKLPPAYHLRPVDSGEESAPGRRDAELARLEAVLWLADEPLSARRLANAADLADTAAAHRLVARLNELYTADSSAFHVE